MTMAITPVISEGQRAAVRDLQRAPEARDQDATLMRGKKHLSGRTVCQSPRANCLSAFPLRKGKARLGEMFQSAQLTVNAFLKFFSSVTLGQCFAISVMGADATGQMHLLQETGVTHYLVFMCVFDVGIG